MLVSWPRCNVINCFPSRVSKSQKGSQQFQRRLSGSAVCLMDVCVGKHGGATQGGGGGGTGGAGTQVNTQEIRR